VTNIVIATQNPGKFREITAILGDLSLRFENLTGISLPEEKGDTLEENAISKAETGFRITNRISIADDTGLEVDSLGGQPGVYSARFAGKDADDTANRKKLLQALVSRPFEERRARFRTIVSIAGIPGESTRVFEGRLDGYITSEERGNFGFGYDSIFLLPDIDKTLAELLPDVKNGISHRKLALLKARDYLEQVLQGQSNLLTDTH
jgi:XTP/dITP diphosphohydrolase